MMMMGLYFTKKVPFHEVYVHALVRDEKGQKMSKSKGNVIDPLVLMNEFGADSLRMTLCSMAAQGRDIKLSKQRVEGYRNFVTKIWNALKLCEINNCSYRDAKISDTKNIFNIWILNELENCRKVAETSIQNYKFNEAANGLYKFTWSIFCDWYLEFTKIIFISEDKKLINETKHITSYVLSNILIMLHPIMPFFTEHVWDKAAGILKKDTSQISRAKWPEQIKLKDTDKSEVNFLIDLISSIRSTRAEMNVPAKSNIKINYSNVSDLFVKVINNHKDILISLTHSSSIEEKEFSKNEGMVQVIFNDGLIYMSLKGIIDINEEKKRLEKNVNKIDNEIKKINSKLNDKSFLNNAPEEVINEQKNREKEYELAKNRIYKTIESLE